MRHETQPPIEATLTAYAEARRRTLGTPPAMPDPVRSRLHREIERVADAASQAGSPNRPAWWTWCLRPSAWGVAAALAGGVWITWQSLGPKPADVTLVAARPQPPAAPSFAPSPEAASAPSPATSASRAVFDSATVPARPAQLTSAEATGPESTAVPPPPAAVRALSLEQRNEPGKGIDTGARRETARYGLRSQDALAPAAEARRVDDSLAAGTLRTSGPAPTMVAGFGDATGQRQLQQRFAQNRLAPITPVLNQFQVEQVGQQLRLVDADGSVYLATLGTETGVAQAQAAQPAPVASPFLGRANRQARAQAVAPIAAGGARDGAPPMQVLTLNATGTNWQLQQQVVFTGNLFVTNLPGVPVVNDSTTLGTNVESLSQLFRNASVNGLVTVGGTNQYAVEAVPTVP
jgi:hypothetical protein